MFLDGLDTTDQKILKLLIENARLSYSEISEKVGLSRVAVKMRINAMEERGIIEQYTTIINPQKISGAISCYFEIETKPDALDDIIKHLYDNKTVTQIYRITGDCRLHVHAVASCNDEMENFIRNEIDNLKGVVKVSSNVILSRIKDVKGLRL